MLNGFLLVVGRIGGVDPMRRMLKKGYPMGRQIIDLSIAIEAGLPSDPEMVIPKIDYVNHSQEQREDALNYLIPEK